MPCKLADVKGIRVGGKAGDGRELVAFVELTELKPNEKCENVKGNKLRGKVVRTCVWAYRAPIPSSPTQLPAIAIGTAIIILRPICKRQNIHGITDARELFFIAFR